MNYRRQLLADDVFRHFFSTSLSASFMGRGFGRSRFGSVLLAVALGVADLPCLISGAFRALIRPCDGLCHSPFPLTEESLMSERRASTQGSEFDRSECGIDPYSICWIELYSKWSRTRSSSTGSDTFSQLKGFAFAWLRLLRGSGDEVHGSRTRPVAANEPVAKPISATTNREIRKSTPAKELGRSNGREARLHRCPDSEVRLGPGAYRGCHPSRGCRRRQ